MAQDKPNAPVMVIGGGIAGMQAALSLSGAGHGVFLVEQAASLGGMVPKLHRIYPLCACCKIDPRVAACEQDPNIDVLADTSIEDISGNVGEFTVSVSTGGRTREISVGAIVLATGIETFDPSAFDTYAYGHLPNVVTSVDYEMLQKPLGPGKGVVKRPSDGETPKKIAWLQCVGSRDINKCDAPYCSSVCCMHALKEAVNTIDVDDQIEATIFYMDMRTHGKGYEAYMNQAQESGVTLVRTRVHSVEPIPGSDDLSISYALETGEQKTEIFDMAVLSVGLRPSSTAAGIAEKAGIGLAESDFVATGDFQPVATDVPGIFVCGGAKGPNDIGQTLAQAGAAVSEVAALIGPKPFSAPFDYPQPSDAGREEPKILIAYTLCPGSDPDMGPQLEKAAGSVPHLAKVVQINGDMLDALTRNLNDSGANRLVFASCTPVIHKGLLEEALKRAGLNPWLYEMVDLRAIDPDTAPAQLSDRIRMGAVRAALVTPPGIKSVPVTKRALVVGGGVAGLESALAVAAAGYPVTLVEKTADLGGHGRHVRTTWQGFDARAYMKDLITAVESHERIDVLTEARIKENRGFEGCFTTTVETGGKESDIEHGVTILASGGNPVKPKEYLYGESDKVYSWSELSGKMLEDPAAIEGAESAVFIQCVGSREPDRPYCSNFCCTFAARTAIDLKTKNPDMDVTILFREMRTFGEREDLYREARSKGVIFIRYDLDNKPVVAAEGDKLSVTVREPILGRPVVIKADFVSLQTAIRPAADGELAGIFKVDLDSDGFFAESPEKLKPSDTTRDGVYAAGLGLYPKDTGESIVQAKAAAARALEMLARDSVEVGGLVAEVMPEKCAVCCTCVRTCPFSVPFIDGETGAAYIDPALCKGCGMCVAECPGKAIVMASCSDQMLTRAPAVLMGL